jgi:EmrB/QacA subfamily drug resistance transporter
MQPTQALDQQGQRAALLMVLLNGFSMPMMLSAVNVALPSIADELAMDAVLLSWIPMAYLMASAALVLTFGRIADMFGRKRMYLIGTVGLIVTSILAAYANSGAMIIACRLLQGVSAAMVYGTHIAIISSAYPPEQRGRMIGLTVSVIYVGLTCGPFLGGWLIGLFGWRAAFLVHVPTSVAALIVGIFMVKAEWRAEHAGRFDYVGALLYTIAIVALMVGISSLPQWSSVFLIALGGVGFWLFFHHQHNRRDPLFDVSLFYTSRVFTLSCIASVLMYTATFSNVVMISLHLQYLQEMTPMAAGVVLMAQPIVMALVSPYAGKLSDRVEARVIASIGMAITAIGLALIATIDATTPLPFTVVYLMTIGLGFSLFSSPNANAIMGSVASHQYGIAGSSVATMRVIGQVTSMGIVAMVFALLLGPVQITPDIYPQLEHALRWCFGVSAAFCLPGIYLSLVRGRSRACKSASGE